MSQKDQVRIINETLDALLRESDIGRQLALIYDAKRVFDSLHNEVWHQHIRDMAKRNERDWKL